MKSLLFMLVSILSKQSSQSETVESELALNSSPSSSGGSANEESSAAVAAAGSSESTAEDNPSTYLGAAVADNPSTYLGAAVAAPGSSESTAEDNPPTYLGAAVAAPGSSESTAEDNPPTSLGELAIPAIISVGIYGSIPPAVHVDHGHAPLYEPLVAFICLAVFTSLGNIICVLLRPGARGVDLLMGLSIVSLLVAFFLRILLLPP